MASLSISEICQRAAQGDRGVFKMLSDYFPTHELTVKLLEIVFAECKARGIYQDLVDSYAPSVQHPFWEILCHQPPCPLDADEQAILKLLNLEIRNYWHESTTWCCCRIFDACM